MKYRYSVDCDNQLQILPPRSKKPIKAKGRFGVNNQNELIYSLNEPLSWRRLYNLDSKITFKGKWRIDGNHNLELSINETRGQDHRDRLALKGEIISCANDTLAFEIVSHGENTSFQILTLSGSWQADEFNRLSFYVKKSATPDILTLEAAWQLNKSQQITYKYEKVNLKTRTKSIKTLIFDGYWDINTANRLTYIISCSSSSRFDFRIQLGSPSFYPKQGVLKYKIGIGIRQAAVSRIIYLYGAWKFNRNLGLSFEMDYGRGRIHTIEFGADVYLTPQDKLTFALADRRGEPLGFTLTFTHSFLKKLDAQAFLKLKGNLTGKQGIETGLRIPF